MEYHVHSRNSLFDCFDGAAWFKLANLKNRCLGITVVVVIALMPFVLISLPVFAARALGIDWPFDRNHHMTTWLILSIATSFALATLGWGVGQLMQSLMSKTKKALAERIVEAQPDFLQELGERTRQMLDAHDAPYHGHPS
jgi:hypothetical protein